MNNIEIDITITMGETCQNTMKLSEAKALYETLKDLFENGAEKKITSINPIKEKIQNESLPAYDKPITTEVPGSEGCIPNNPTMPPPPPYITRPTAGLMDQVEPNPKVEAARARTAQRTARCRKG